MLSRYCMTQAQALLILKTGVNVFLTGEPGSGKTHTISEYVAYLRDRGVEPAITASTGIAATHLGGQTIHSWSGIGIKTSLDGYDLDRLASTEYLVRRIGRAKVLIIDEVSMLLPETLSSVEAVCREIKRRDEPFGGMQIVMVGDFFQLPPVVKRDLEEDSQTTFIEKASARFAYDAPAWLRANPVVCYLTEQHRQDDKDFLGVLAAIRARGFNDEHLAHLKKRKIKIDDAPKDTPKLFSHNVDVDRVNDEMLALLPSRLSTFTMSAQGQGTVVASLKKSCLSPETLSLKEGAVVMFTKNNPRAGFVNGTLGTVHGFSGITRQPVIKTRSGLKIEVETADWTVEENGRVRAKITQLPLRLAWAITVHKSQGMSLDAAVMDLSQVFEFGQGYVALSRVRRLDGLYLLGWNERAFQVHPEVLVQDQLFRTASEEAEQAFAKIPAAEIKTLQENFIKACGSGSIASRKKRERR